MPILKLFYTDEYGTSRTAEVTRDGFTVGRHSACDLCIPDERLSRTHIRFEKRDDDFYVSDCGSSNGSELNGIDLDSPERVRDGDDLVLGGGVRMQVRLEVDPVLAQKPLRQATASASPVTVASGEKTTETAAGIPILYLAAAPLFALIVLVFAGGLYYLFSGSSAQNVNVSQDIDDTIDDEPPANKREDDDVEPRRSPGAGNSGTVVTSPTPGGSNSAPPANLSETAKVEQFAAQFLRRIAMNDPKAFITSEQAKRLSPKIKQFGGSAALAANIASAKKNSAQIGALASSKNLKPQFLAVAAINKLGNTRGDVLQTAQGMAEVLDKLGTQLGNELADDSLLVIAAYDQGLAGDHMKMRNMLQDLSNKFPDSSRAIRTIWFLEQNKRISAAEFERALSFLAIGTICQDPKEFGVSSDALTL